MGGTTSDRNDPRLTHGIDTGPRDQAEVYLVLSEDERAKGFIRPLRMSYRHIVCGTVTTMNVAIAETYARQPSYYGATYCCGCRMHLAVGAEGEFTWMNPDGTDSQEKVGT